MKNLAILCSGLEKRKTRGYENSSLNLFLLLKQSNKCNVFLYKGSGEKSDGQIPLKSKFKGLVESIFRKTIKPLFNDDYYGIEYFVFALYFICYCILKVKKYDFIYSKEPRVMLTLKRFRFFLRGNPKLVFNLGQMMPPKVFHGVADIIHLVNNKTHKQALEEYNTPNKFFLIPNPISSAKKFSSKNNKNEIIRKYGIKTTKIIVSIGSDAKIKRMAYVISEVSKLDNSWTLMLVGNIDKEIINLGHGTLKDRFITTKVPPEEIGEIFTLAHFSVLASTSEGFGNVVIESMMNSIPVFVHKRPLNEYIVNDERLLVDMTKEGALSEKINNITSNDYIDISNKCYKRYKACFSSKAILPLYLKMFDSI
ncbi:glycosyltransferase family 4 protein [Marinilabiliaceae bacterium ANBcel2]|nr:glycosyltransferase family 4 protein [Marinilabiliaceae bacterium ANBcel2]